MHLNLSVHVSFHVCSVEMVAKSLVQSCISEMLPIAPLLKFSFSFNTSCTIEGPLKNNAELIVKTCASEISTITVGKNGVIPAKQLRDNTITSLDLSSKGLGVDGALILAALIKDNTSVQHLDISSNNLGSVGGKAIAASIAENGTITSVSPLFDMLFIVFLVLILALLSLFSWGT